jgi:hypothetical protein
MCHEEYAENNNTRTANRSYENVVNLKYLGTTLTHQNLIQAEIKRRLNLYDTFYHSVQNIYSSPLLTKSVRIKIFKTIILPVVLYGCEAWCLT